MAAIRVAQRQAAPSQKWPHPRRCRVSGRRHCHSDASLINLLTQRDYAEPSGNMSEQGDDSPTEEQADNYENVAANHRTGQAGGI